MSKSKLLRMDNIGIVVDDMKAVVAFFSEIGLEVEGETTVEGKWVDGIIGLKKAKCDIVMMRTPDGNSRLELSKFRSPKATGTKAMRSVNTFGYLRVMFAVTDLKDLVNRLRSHGAKLVGEITQYENIYLLCYVSGPEGIMVGLAQPLTPE
jgi:predicted enzyme related to lactoylglutathione lyase